MTFSRLTKTVTALAIVSALAACGQKSSEELLASAEKYIDEGNSQAAIIELKNAITVSPQDHYVRLLLGELQLKSGNALSAAKEFRRSIELGGDANTVFPLLLTALYYTDQYQEVVDEPVPERLVDIGPKSKAALYKFISVIRIADSDLTIMDEFKSDMTADDTSIAKAYQLFYDQKVDEAAAELASMERVGVRTLEMEYIYGLIASRQGNYEQAVAAFSTINQAIPFPNTYAFLEIEALLRQEKYDEAEPKIERIYQLDKAQPIPNLQKATISFKRENFNDALNFASEAINNGLNSAPAQLIAGVSAYQLQKWEVSYQYLSALASRQGYVNDQVSRVLANLQIRLGYNSEAANTLERIQDISPLDADLFALTGMQLARSGNSEKAKELLGKANQADTDNNLNKVREALAYMGSDDERVISTLSDVVERDPSIAVAWMQLADTHIRSGNLQQAFAVADEWAAIDELSGRTLKGIIHFRIEQYTEAAEVLKAVNSSAPDFQGANLYLLQAYEALGQYQDVSELAQSILTQSPDNEAVLLSLLRSTRSAPLKDSVIKFIEDLSKNNPTLIEPKVTIANLASTDGNPQKAISLLSASLAELTPLGLMTLGDAYVKTSKFDDALEVFKQWADIKPTSNLPIARIVGVYELKGENSRGLEIVNNALREFGENNELLQMLKLNFLTKLDRFDAADNTLAELKTMNVSDPILLDYYAGLLAFKKQDYQQAEELIGAKYANSQDFNTALILAKALQQNGKVQEAKAVLLNEYDKLESPPEGIKHILADFYLHNSLFEDAALLYSEMINDGLESAELLNNFAYAKQSLQELDEAYKLAKKALDIQPNNPFLMDTLGWIEFERGNLNDSYTQLSKAAEALPDYTPVQLHFGELLIALNFKEKAVDVLRPLSGLNQAQETKKSELLSSIE